MGATTYRQVFDRYDLGANPQQWRDWYEDRPCWVFSHHALPSIPGIDLRFVAGDVRPVFEDMTATLPGKNVWLIGGGDLVGQFDDAGLLDEVWLGMRPVFLGAGKPLLPRRITTKRLSIREVRHVGQAVRLILDVAPRR
jgi:dihydrofolate reductase